MALVTVLPRSTPVIVLLGLLCAISTIGSGLFADDVLMRMRLTDVETAWGASPWWDLYTFARPDLNAGLRDAGFHPWWSDPEVKMVFFRPLSAATHVLDYSLWPDRPVFHHLHSVLWYGLAIAAAVGIYRRLGPPTPSFVPVAGSVFAVAAPHMMTVAWIAGRNTLIAFMLGCVLLGLHVRSHEEGTVGLRLAALATLVIGLLASEAMLAGLAYVVAWQLCLGSGSWRRRTSALWPYALVVVGWRWLYVMAGFGTQATGIYHDPGSDVLGFFEAVLTNLPALLANRWLFVPIDGWIFFPTSFKIALAVIGCVVSVVLVGLGWSLLQQDARSRFWALGMVLSIVPFTATMPMDRLVLFAGLGSSALLASVAGAPRPSRLIRRARIGLLVLHIPLAAIFGIVRGLTVAPAIALFTNGVEQAPRDGAVPGQTFVYVTGVFHRVHYTTLMRQTTGDPGVPRRSVVLSSVSTTTVVTRRDRDTLEVTADGGFMAVDLDRIHRRDVTELEIGQRIHLPDLDAEILTLTADGRPATVAFHFRVPLDDPSLRWLVVDSEPGLLPNPRTREFALPPQGSSVQIDGLNPVR